MDWAAACAELTRAADPDRFFATLFVPADRRPYLFALYAFDAEAVRVRAAVSEPMLGEIRLQWWRDVVEGKRVEEARANPISAGLLAAISDNRLPTDAFLGLLETRTNDLYDDPLLTIADLEAWCGATAGAVFRLGSIVLARGEDPGGIDASGHGGVAWGITGLLKTLAYDARRGRVNIPVEMMARHGVSRTDIVSGMLTFPVQAVLADMRAMARVHLSRAQADAQILPTDIRSAFLPLSLVESYFHRMERSNFDLFRQIPDVPQWKKQWRLWRAAR